MHSDFSDQVLVQHLKRILPDVEPQAIDLLRHHLQWVELPAGEVLLRQGDPGDSMYLSISGRLRVTARDDAGTERVLREMGRGEVIGEMSLYTDQPRSATVVAIRDSVLVRLAKPEFVKLLASSAQMSIALTRQMIRRLTAGDTQHPIPAPVTMSLLPITEGVDLANFADRLAVHLGRLGKVCIVDANAVDVALEQPGLARSEASDISSNRRIAQHLDTLELTHDFVLLVGDADASPWTQRCSKHSDEMLLLADARQTPALHVIEQQYLMQRHGKNDAAQILILLHQPDASSPSGTSHWLARRPVTDHVHVRLTQEADMARLARIQSRTAVGLVLAGGGAKGLAHLGLYRALQERGIAVDFVGGTSIGAVMAAMVSSDQPLSRLVPIARAAFAKNPTGDFNLLPLISLIRGHRLRDILKVALREVFGHLPDIEDLWKNYFCVASNYTQARVEVITQGPLNKAMMASMAIPGALPPVLIKGDMLCDGGTFNNFPVDVMRNRRGVGKVIGMDLGVRKPRSLAFDEVPGNWALLLDRFRPRARRRYKLPSLMAYLLNVTIMYSASRQLQSKNLTDLYFHPPLERVGMLQWKRFDSIEQQGYAHACEVLNAMTETTLRPFRPLP